MERYFILVVNEISDSRNTVSCQRALKEIRDYHNIFLRSLKEANAAPLPQNNFPIDWAVCVGISKVVYKGEGVEAFQEFVSSSFVADIPSEPWDLQAFSNLNNCAVDVILEWEDCPEFWKSFSPSNSVKIFHKNEASTLNPQLFWRGSLKMRDPQNTSHFGQLEDAELNYSFDELDLLVSQLRTDNFHANVLKRTTFCSFLELVNAFDANAVPLIFYTSTSFVLTISAQNNSFWKAMDENVSFLFRLDYASEEVDNRGKEMGAQSIHFLSHWTDGKLKLFVLKGCDQLQHLANGYVRLHSKGSFPFSTLCQSSSFDTSSFDHLLVDRLEREIRRLQLLALQTWIKENGTIDETTMNNLLNEVVAALSKDRRRFTINSLPERTNLAVLSDADLLKKKLDKKINGSEGDRCAAAAMGNRLLQPNAGRLISVDVPHLIRCMNKKQLARSPMKLRPAENDALESRLKPECDQQTALTTPWPRSATLKYHGIHYNLSVEDEKLEKQHCDYQDKWVPLESASATWCNPWSINSSTSYPLLSNRSRKPAGVVPPPPTTAATRTPRTPKKSQQPTRDLAQLRKSPRLLAKSGATATRTSKRTPSKKHPSAGGGGGAALPLAKDTFKQQLKAVIIKVLADQKITTKDPIFRTCANKLSVICMALLNDSKNEVTPRQMYQVAKSQAKQVLQFVKT